ncbi:hypothetical protein [Salinigranum halophilum]|nr:hypothetical protein [Salinigranum halophilum]
MYTSGERRRPEEVRVSVDCSRVMPSIVDSPALGTWDEGSTGDADVGP